MTKKQETWQHLVAVQVTPNRRFEREGYSNEPRYGSITFIWQDEKHKLHEQRHDPKDDRIAGWIHIYVLSGHCALEDYTSHGFGHSERTYYNGMMTRKSWSDSQVYAVQRYCRRQLTGSYVETSSVKRVTSNTLAKCGVLRSDGRSGYTLQLDHPLVIEHLALLAERIKAEERNADQKEIKTNANEKAARLVLEKHAHINSHILFNVESLSADSVSVYIVHAADLRPSYEGNLRNIAAHEIKSRGLEIRVTHSATVPRITYRWGSYLVRHFDQEGMTQRMESLVLAQGIARELSLLELG